MSSPPALGACNVYGHFISQLATENYLEFLLLVQTSSSSSSVPFHSLTTSIPVRTGIRFIRGENPMFSKEVTFTSSNYMPIIWITYTLMNTQRAMQYDIFLAQVGGRSSKNLPCALHTFFEIFLWRNWFGFWSEFRNIRWNFRCTLKNLQWTITLSTIVGSCKNVPL